MKHPSPKVLLGELRSALHRVKLDPFDPASDRNAGQASVIGTVGYCLVMLGDTHHEDAFSMLTPLLPQELGGARMEEWLGFLWVGSDALIKRIAEEVPWIDDPRVVAAQWLGAWLWQCTTQDHARDSKASIQHNGMHVCLGLGGVSAKDDPPNAYLAMEWDMELESARHVIIHLEEGGLEAGQLNDAAALKGFGGIPPHLPTLSLADPEAP